MGGTTEKGLEDSNSCRSLSHVQVEHLGRDDKKGKGSEDSKQGKGLEYSMQEHLGKDYKILSKNTFLSIFF